MKLRAAVFCFAIALGVIPSNNAQAILGGVSALNSPIVVKVVVPGGICSGTLIQPQVIVTAAHCLVSSGTAISPTSIGVYAPGVDTSQSSIVAHGFQMFYPSGYTNSSTYTEPNDIAVVVLDQRIKSNNDIKFANYNLVQEIVNSGVSLTAYGYGATTQGGYSVSIPLRMNSYVIPQLPFNGYRGYERTYLNYAASSSGSTCPGDSGGPVIAEYKSQIYLVTVHSGGLGPCSNDPGRTPWQGTGTISGEYQYLLNAATTLIAKLKPTDVSNIKITSSALTGNITWDLPKNSPVVPTGYVVKDAASNELCRTTTNTCQVSLKPGSNLLTVFALAGSISSDGVAIEYIVKNAANPDFVGLDTYQTQVSVKWSPIRDFGGATPNATYVEIRDEADGSVLCTALSTQNECRFSFLQKGYNLLLNVRSDLGQTESVQIGRFSGILQSSLVSRTISNLQNINTQLNSYLLSNPGYKTEISQLQSQLPVITSNFIFTEDVLTQVLDTRNNVSALVSRIIANPKKATITCIKGKLTKKVTAVNPKCPASYKLKN